jgi:predicted transcriptional regulator
MSTITISKQVMAQELAGETVLLDLASESYFGLDEVGTRVWQLLQSGKNQPAIVDTLLEEYEVERAKLEQDVAELLNRLSDAGLVTIG